MSEANALTRSVGARIRAARADAQRYRELIEALRAGKFQGEERVARAREAEEARRAVMGMVEELGEQGIEVKGLDEGLVDFPALYQGREVYLCWRLGEPEVAWWHPIHTGAAGRQPVRAEDEGWQVWS